MWNCIEEIIIVNDLPEQNLSTHIWRNVSYIVSIENIGKSYFEHDPFESFTADSKR